MSNHLIAALLRTNFQYSDHTLSATSICCFTVFISRLCLKMIFYSMFHIFYILVISSAGWRITGADAASEHIEFLVTDNSKIFRIRENGHKQQYFTNATAIGDVDYYLRKNVLFWIDAAERRIHAQPLDPNSRAFCITFKQQRNWEPVALAVDFVNDKIYVADALGAKIDVFELDGRYGGIAIGANLIRPLDVKVDPYEGLLFVLDGSRIVRAHLDASPSATIVKRGITTLRGLAVDSTQKRVYWSRALDSLITTSNYQGDDVRTLDKAGPPGATWSRFAIFNDTVFWTNDFVGFGPAACRNDWGPGARRAPIARGTPLPAIKALHSSAQIPASSSCGSNNGECEHMCLGPSLSVDRAVGSRRCLCNAGWQLADNSKNCSLPREFLVYALPSVLKSSLAERCADAFCEPYLPIGERGKSFGDFSYSFADNYLYYIRKDPLAYDAIYKVRPNESTPRVFAVGVRENYQSLSVDWITSDLYFADAEAGRIGLMSTRNASRKIILLEDLQRPEDVAVHPARGLVFFLQTNESSRVTLLSRAEASGANLTTFGGAAALRKSCGFALDVRQERIYWYEWRATTIRHSDFDLSEVLSISSPHAARVHAMAVHERRVYVATASSEGIWRLGTVADEPAELIVPDFANRITRLKVFGADSRRIVYDKGGFAERSNETLAKVSDSVAA